MMNQLPAGKRGQALALALTVVVLAAVWLGGMIPALDWFSRRTEYLTQQRTLASRMAAVATTAPSLQHQLEAIDAAAPPPRAIFQGGSDAVAGAALQQAVQDIAAHTGATVLSAEMLPAENTGAYRRIGIHLMVSAPWPVLVTLLATALQGTPRMLIDDVSLRPQLALGARDMHPMEAGFTVIAFHAGTTAR